MASASTGPGVVPTPEEVGVTFRGMLIGNSQGFTISNNTIQGVSFSGSSAATGIVVTLTVNGGTISGNKVSDIKNTNTIKYVMKNGRLYDANTMNEVWPRQRAVAETWKSKDAGGIVGSQK